MAPKATKNLGLVKAIHVGVNPPLNVKMIWYNDSTLPYTTGPAKVHYFYDVVTSEWQPLSGTISGSSPSSTPLFFADVATTDELPSNVYDNPSFSLTASVNGALPQIDGVTVPLGAVILVWKEVDQRKNGLYEVSSLGGVSSKYVLTRLSSYNSTAEIFPSQVNVLQGSTLGGKYFLEETYNPVVGTDNIVFMNTNAPASLIVDITHAALVTLKNNSSLLSGTFYRITDFQTIYDQPDYDSSKNEITSPVVKYSNVSPIVVLATSTETLSVDAYQPEYPDDSIKYILEFTTPVSLTPTKGRIIERKDLKGNRTDYDFRTVLFKRYYDSSTSMYSSYYDTGDDYLEMNTFDPYMYSIDLIFDNHFGDIWHSYYQVTNSIFDLPNMVFLSETHENNFPDSNCNVTAIAGFVNNDISNGILYNAIFGDFFHNNCSSCLIRIFDSKNSTLISNHFSRNLDSIVFDDCNFRLNSLGLLSQCDLTSVYANSNRIVEMSQSTITNCQFHYNDIERLMHSTINCKSFGWNRVELFWYNTITTVGSGAFQRNTFKNISWVNIPDAGDIKGFSDNKGQTLQESTFGNDCYGNDLGVMFSGCTVGNYFGMDLEILGDDPASGNVFKNEVWNTGFQDFIFGNIFNGQITDCTIPEKFCKNRVNVPLLAQNFSTATHVVNGYDCEIDRVRISNVDLPIGTLVLDEFGNEIGYVFSSYLDGDIWKYLLVDTLDTHVYGSFPWSITSDTVPGTVSTIGSCKDNTDRIISSQGLIDDYAAKLSKFYNIGSTDFRYGWCLPSKDELSAIYTNRAIVGNNFSGDYWSSTENPGDSASAFSTASIEKAVNTIII